MRAQMRVSLHVLRFTDSQLCLHSDETSDRRFTFAAGSSFAAVRVEKRFARENVFTSLQSKNGISGANSRGGTNYVNLPQVPAHTIT